MRLTSNFSVFDNTSWVSICQKWSKRMAQWMIQNEAPALVLDTEEAYHTVTETCLDLTLMAPQHSSRNWFLVNPFQPNIAIWQHWVSISCRASLYWWYLILEHIDNYANTFLSQSMHVEDKSNLSYPTWRVPCVMSQKWSYMGILRFSPVSFINRRNEQRLAIYHDFRNFCLSATVNRSVT